MARVWTKNDMSCSCQDFIVTQWYEMLQGNLNLHMAYICLTLLFKKCQAIARWHSNSDKFLTFA